MKICLSMIVKNEEHCIIKCLESVKKYIDYWIICDTGSTDNTMGVIKEYLKDIPGELHQNEWIDFSTNRNIALDLSKQSNSDYILFIDADDFLVINDNNCFRNLSESAYNIEIHHDNSVYPRISLVSSKLNCKYVGVLHETLEVPLNTKTPILQNCYIQYGANGSRWKDPFKYVKDASVFENALDKDPDNARYVFYCAQSYRDAAKLCKSMQEEDNVKIYLTKAASFYHQRAMMNNGWIEEKAYAALELGRILEQLAPNDISNILNCYSMSYNLVPTKVEPIVAICSFLRKQKLFQLSYLFAKIGINIPKPSSGLFIIPDCYNWVIKDELAIAAFYIGKFQEAYDVNKNILNTSSLSIEDRTRIHRNLVFCQEKLR